MRDKNEIGVALVKELCPICLKSSDGPIIMNTRLSKKRAQEVEEMHGKTVGFTKEPCDECKELKSKGFVLIGVVEKKTEDRTNPYRSGNLWAISESAAAKLFNDNPPKSGVAFIDVNVAHEIGLPDANLDA